MLNVHQLILKSGNLKQTDRVIIITTNIKPVRCQFLLPRLISKYSPAYLAHGRQLNTNVVPNHQIWLLHFNCCFSAL